MPTLTVASRPSFVTTEQGGLQRPGDDRLDYVPEQGPEEVEAGAPHPVRAGQQGGRVAESEPDSLLRSCTMRNGIRQ